MTTLVDTSVWIDHLRRGDGDLARLLEAGGVLAHPFVVGELACGVMARRDEIMGALDRLPRAVVATDDEVRVMIDERRLHGRGLGWVDAHLLASALLTGCRLWTKDRALNAAARDGGVELV